MQRGPGRGKDAQQRDHEQQQRKQGKEEVIGELRGPIGGGVVRDAPVEELEEAEGADLRQAAHGRKLVPGRRRCG